MSVLDSIPHAIADGPRERRHGIRWWLLAVAVGAVLLAGYLVAAGLIALVMATAGSAQFDPVVVLVAALPGWLALHQTALKITDAPLSILPLLPTVLVMLLIAAASAWVARRSRLRRPDQAWPLITAMGLVHAFVGTAIAVVLDGPVNAVPVDAFLSCGLVATIASAAGVANRCGLIYLVWERVEAEVWSGLRLGLLALAALVAAGGVVLLAGICLSAPEMVAALARLGSTAGDAIGATLLSLLYLPNAVVAGWSFAAGTGLSIGRLEIQPLHVAPGPVPDLPLLAVLPTHDSAAWWAIVLGLPLVVGLLVGTSARRVPGSLARRLLAVGVAAAVAAMGTLLLAHVAGGDLGNGPFGQVTLQPVALAAATLCWIAIPAAAVTWLAGPDLDDELGADQADAEETTGSTTAGADSADEATSKDDATGDPSDASASDAADDTETGADDATDVDGDRAGTPVDDNASEAEATDADALELDDLVPEIPHAREAAESEPPRSKPAEIDPTEFDGDLTGDDRR
ncbi:DUF6350 family protein [Saccharopolyspora sp. NPDC050642]|uniref:cell division protein PerM n=1 Tax=Saccharopolyspora sp. NPDC050642 TaxID=3157099 RepID=UPI00340A82D4